MRDVICNLLSTSIQTDSIGVEKKVQVSVECPITKVEDVYADEFYSANELGYKPSLRLRISSLNYNNEPELVYMGTTYSIIRTQEINADEIILICERKVNNV
jgi:hypothetical protein